jgi:hypothetical protein
MKYALIEQKFGWVLLILLAALGCITPGQFYFNPTSNHLSKSTNITSNHNPTKSNLILTKLTPHINASLTHYKFQKPHSNLDEIAILIINH